jgi:uncharacterized protein (TIGR00297 family)
MSPLLLLLIGAPLNLIAGVLSFLRKSVDVTGAATGAVVGTVIFVSAGPLLWLLLATFVVSSSAFTRFRESEKRWLGAVQEKGGRRDMVQVLANGGVGVLMALLLRLTFWPGFALGLAAAFASANADTWASEIGVLSRRKPVSLIPPRRIPRGVSGGVTLLGLLASLCGSLLVALIFGLENLHGTKSLAQVAVLTGFTAGAGMLGSLIDSVLGSTVQAQYEEAKELHGGSASPVVTERRVSHGAANVLIHGVPFITNDVVNLLSTACAAVIGMSLASLL